MCVNAPICRENYVFSLGIVYNDDVCVDTEHVCGCVLGSAWIVSCVCIHEECTDKETATCAASEETRENTGIYYKGIHSLSEYCENKQG